MLLELKHGKEGTLSDFITRFTNEIRGVDNAHSLLMIQSFMIGLRPSHLFWSLVERTTTIVPEALQRANQYIAIDAMVSGKRGEPHKRPRQKRPQSALIPRSPQRRSEQPNLPRPRSKLTPLNLTRTEFFLHIKKAY